MEPNSPTVFFSYAAPDRDRVMPFFEYLQRRNIDVWIDCRCIRPGQSWDFEIQRALDKATMVVAFVSNNSVTRRGYVQRELKLALDKRREKLVDDIYIIPIILDGALLIPAELKEIHCISSEDPTCKDQVVNSILYQLERLGAKSNVPQSAKMLTWERQMVKESWDGIPGYDFEAGIIEFQSEYYKDMNSINDLIRGEFVTELLRQRRVKLSPSPEWFNFGQDRFLRTNTYDAHFSEPSLVGKIVSVVYSIHTYGAGAAHPNQHFETFAFALEPLATISSLAEVFKSSSKALEFIQNDVRRQMYKDFSRYDSENNSISDTEWINRGTQEWKDFCNFSFKSDGISLLFPPYQVACYAAGPQFADLAYSDVAQLMRPEFRSALGIQHLS